ncbi:MAG: hypothetical protein K2O12_05435, partial [Muribaculaceae bacterium]|nr:hypothetical protein [Muribaculaceae bacterium]
GIGMCQAKFETAAIVGSTTKITPDTPIVFTRTSSGYDVESTQLFGVSVYSEGSLIGWLNLAGYNEIVGSDWEDAGTGTLTESFISGTYTQAGSSTKTVSVQVSKNNKNLIRICRYYSSIDNTLEIDMTNPQNIVVPIQDTGVEDNVDGKTMIASYSALWPNEMEDGTYITLSGNTITFPASSMLLNWPDAPADSQYETDANTWYISGRVASTLVLPGTVGIEDIAADSEDTANAPVEYFNLQGMKVSNPVSGQIYITRQGNKVTKVLVK